MNSYRLSGRPTLPMSPSRQTQGHISVKITVEVGDETFRVTEDTDTALLHAAAAGRLDIVKCLLKENANANSLYKDSTPLIESSKNGHEDVVEFICQTAEVDLNQCDVHGVPPLVYAAINGYTNIVQLLCDYGADVNVRGRLGMTALHEAVISDNAKLVQILVKAKASIDVKNSFKQTPAGIAKSLKHASIAQFLKEARRGNFHGITPKKPASHIRKSGSNWVDKCDVGYGGSDTDRSLLGDFRTATSADQVKGDSSRRYTCIVTDCTDSDDNADECGEESPKDPILCDTAANAPAVRRKGNRWMADREISTSSDDYARRSLIEASTGDAMKPRSRWKTLRKSSAKVLFNKFPSLLRLKSSQNQKVKATSNSRALPSFPLRPNSECSRRNSSAWDSEVEQSPKSNKSPSQSDPALLATGRRAFSMGNVAMPTSEEEWPTISHEVNTFARHRSENDIAIEESLSRSISMDNARFSAPCTRTTSQTSSSHSDETEPGQTIVKKYYIKSAKIYWTQTDTNAVSIQKARNVAVHGSITSIEAGRLGDGSGEYAADSSSSDDD